MEMCETFAIFTILFLFSDSKNVGVTLLPRLTLCVEAKRLAEMDLLGLTLSCRT